MEPQESKPLNLTKAVRAHEEAEAALGDLINTSPDPKYARMLERVQQNLNELRGDAARSGP